MSAPPDASSAPDAATGTPPEPSLPAPQNSPTPDPAPRTPAQPRVGVITVSYGSGEALTEFLSSLRAHHGDAIEVAVVDNKPDHDGVQELARSYGAHYLPLPENPGYGAGMNAGVQLLRETQAAAHTASSASPARPFDAYFFCNPDVRFIEPVITELAQVLGTDPRNGSIGPRILDDEGTVYPSARNIPSLGTGIGHALLGKIWAGNPWSRTYKNAANYDHRREAGWLSGAAVMVAAAVYDELGGWDEAYFLHFEDIDLGYRIGLAGYANVFEPTLTIVHTGGHSLKRHSAVAERAMTQSAIRFMSKRYPGRLRAPLRWGITLGLRIRGALRALPSARG